MADDQAPPPPPGDGRRSVRKRTLFGGRVASRDGAILIDCMIKDLSEEGARITIARDKVIPTRVYLIHSRGTHAYEAEVTWIKPPQYGLKFVGAHDLDAPLPREMAFLKAQFEYLKKLSR